MPPKPQPWYASLNQPPRSPKDGRNRKPSAPTHRSPPDRADPYVDPGAHDTSAVTWRTLNTGIAFISHYNSTPPTIPYAGVRAGEIIGYRAWFVLEGNALCSLAHHFLWEPNAVIEGKIDEIVESNAFINKQIFGGVYSYATKEQICAEVRHYRDDNFPTLFSFEPLAFRLFYCLGIAIGTIKCWGEVVEHEKGWRAQYAKLQSINLVIGAVDIDKLRERYKV